MASCVMYDMNIRFHTIGTEVQALSEVVMLVILIVEIYEVLFWVSLW
jgi:hypothetical protein